MTGGIDRADAALWRRAAGIAAAGEAATEPDPLLLAAYAENRLGRPGTDPEADRETVLVEGWLAENPDRIADIAAARAAAELDVPAPPAVVARATALVREPAGNVVPLRRRPAPPSWRSAFAWSSIAASLIVASLIGFSVGSSDVLDLDSTGSTQVLVQDFIGSQTPVLDNGDLDSGI